MSSRFLVPLLLLSSSVLAEVHPVGQLQQELTSWGTNGNGTSGKNIGDGGAYGADHNSNGASWIGLSASETLTHNYQGIAHVSYELDVDEINNISGREAWLGIANPQSVWRFGTFISPYRRSTSEWDPYLGTFMQARGNGAMSANHATNIHNAIDYSSNWYGLDIDFLYAFDEEDRNNDGEADKDYSSSISIGWDRTNWELAASYQDDTGPGNGIASKLAGRYQGQEWSFVLQHEQTHLNGFDSQYSYINSSYHDKRTEYSFGIGTSRHQNLATPALDYINLGMKHGLTEDAMVHLGYRLTKEQRPNVLKESVWGAGLRYRF